jgi:hypothetical protein
MERVMIVLAFLIMGCQAENTYNEAQLVGNWDALEWVDITNNKTIDVKVDFSFQEDGRYIGNYGSAFRVCWEI